jgi:hypothetical protein
MGDSFRSSWIRFLCSGFLSLALLAAKAQSPVRFVENKGQWSEDVDFVTRVPGGKMVIGAGSFRYFLLDHGKLEALHHQSHEPDGGDVDDDQVRGHAVYATFEGADKQTAPQGVGKSSEYYNYFLGADEERWASGAHAYDGILYESLYPGIDLKVYAAREHVKYDLIVSPGGDPSQILVSYQGAEGLALENANLNIHTSLGDII